MTRNHQGIGRPHLVGSVENVASRVAIAEVIGAYGLFLDSRDWDAFGDLFASDATWDVTPGHDLIALPLRGRDAITEAMVERGKLLPEDVLTRHLTTNIVFRHVDGELAGTTSYLVVVFTFSDGHFEIWRTATYVDEFVKDGNQWRFSSRHVHLDTAEVPSSSVEVRGTDNEDVA